MHLEENRDTAFKPVPRREFTIISWFFLERQRPAEVVIMDTDEYEISLNRECNHCQHLVKKITTMLVKRQKKYGLTYQEALAAREQGKLVINDKELARWHDDVEALPIWQQRLREYREALAAMRVSASTK